MVCVYGMRLWYRTVLLSEFIGRHCIAQFGCIFRALSSCLSFNRTCVRKLRPHSFAASIVCSVCVHSFNRACVRKFKPHSFAFSHGLFSYTIPLLIVFVSENSDRMVLLSLTAVQLHCSCTNRICVRKFRLHRFAFPYGCSVTLSVYLLYLCQKSHCR